MNRKTQVIDLGANVNQATINKTPVTIEDIYTAVDLLGGDISFGSEDKLIKTGTDSFKMVVNESNYEDIYGSYKLCNKFLGSLFMTMGFLVREIQWDRYAKDHEFSVNSLFTDNYQEHIDFTFGFLAPPNIFKEVSKKYLKNDSYDLMGLAKHFGISRGHLENYGRTLRIFQYGDDNDYYMG